MIPRGYDDGNDDDDDDDHDDDDDDHDPVWPLGPWAFAPCPQRCIVPPSILKNDNYPLRRELSEGKCVFVSMSASAHVCLRRG